MLKQVANTEIRAISKAYKEKICTQVPHDQKKKNQMYQR